MAAAAGARLSSAGGGGMMAAAAAAAVSSSSSSSSRSDTWQQLGRRASQWLERLPLWRMQWNIDDQKFPLSMVAAAPDGGLIAMVRNENVFQPARGTIEARLEIFSSMGSLLSNTPWPWTNLVELAWSDEEMLVAIFADGTVRTFSPFGDRLHHFVIDKSIRAAENKGVIRAAVGHGCIVVLTTSLKILLNVSLSHSACNPIADCGLRGPPLAMHLIMVPQANQPSASSSSPSSSSRHHRHPSSTSPPRHSSESFEFHLSTSLSQGKPQNFLSDTSIRHDQEGFLPFAANSERGDSDPSSSASAASSSNGGYAVKVILAPDHDGSLLLADATSATNLDVEGGPFVRLAVCKSCEFVACLAASGLFKVYSLKNFTKSISVANMDIRKTPHQMVWVGDNSVALYFPLLSPSGAKQHMVLVGGPRNEWLPYQYQSPIHLVSERDGLRIIGHTLTEFVQQVPSSTLKVYSIGSCDPPALLLYALERVDAEGNVLAAESLRASQKELEEASDTCLDAATCEWDETRIITLIRASLFARNLLDNQSHQSSLTSATTTTSSTSKSAAIPNSFGGHDDIAEQLNSHQSSNSHSSSRGGVLRFVEACRDLRVCRALRQPSSSNVELTISVAQLRSIGYPRLVRRLAKRRCHLLAVRICDYVGISPVDVVRDWCREKVSRDPRPPTSIAVDDSLVKALSAKIRLCPGLDFAEVAYFAALAGRPRLAQLLLANEVDIRRRVRLLLHLGQTAAALAAASSARNLDITTTCLEAMISDNGGLAEGSSTTGGSSQQIIPASAAAVYVAHCKRTRRRWLLQKYFEQSDTPHDAGWQSLSRALASAAEAGAPILSGPQIYSAPPGLWSPTSHHNNSHQHQQRQGDHYAAAVSSSPSAAGHISHYTSSSSSSSSSADAKQRGGGVRVALGIVGGGGGGGAGGRGGSGEPLDDAREMLAFAVGFLGSHSKSKGKTGSSGSADFANKQISEMLKLIEAQKNLNASSSATQPSSESSSSPSSSSLPPAGPFGFIGLSLFETVKALLLRSRDAEALKIKKQFKLNDRSWLQAQVEALAQLGKFADILRLADSFKGPSSVAPILAVLKRLYPPAVEAKQIAGQLIGHLPDVESQLHWASLFGLENMQHLTSTSGGGYHLSGGAARRAGGGMLEGFVSGAASTAGGIFRGLGGAFSR